ncbi:MAG: hypothetical protein IT480_15480 [Gammaproteobacteria bacterium]|nr:hypothetical protein [Gammaproteobacteria bacterium]
MEHRWGLRTSVDVPVRLIGSPGALGGGRVLNVSATGAFVQTRLRLPLLSSVRVEPLADPPPAGHPCAGRAYVVRQVADGVGIEWFEETVSTSVCPGPRLATSDLLELAEPVVLKMHRL